MKLSDPIAIACAPLFEALPPDQSMPHLVGNHPQYDSIVEQVLADPAIAGKPELCTALWLYAGDIWKSHTISQSIETPTGSYWHGIMHRREGDFGNSHYWMRRAASHPLIAGGQAINPDAFVDEVAAARGRDLPELVAKQREEWFLLFEWCAANC